MGARMPQMWDHLRKAPTFAINQPDGLWWLVGLALLLVGMRQLPQFAEGGGTTYSSAARLSRVSHTSSPVQPLTAEDVVRVELRVVYSSRQLLLMKQNRMPPCPAPQSPKCLR